MQVIRDNLARVRERVAAAAERAGRKPSEILLVGVSKYVSAALSAELVSAGCFDLGENRPQQLCEKAAADEVASLDVRWHMIGHLQRNKVARTVPLVSMIHSVDSPRLLKAIDQTASELGKRQSVLLEVNCSGDAEKHGFTESEVRDFVPQLSEFSSVEVRGLMTMAAGSRDLTTAAANFATLRKLRDELGTLAPAGVEIADLSMGMTADFEVAIAEGATIIRVGSALWEGVV